MPHSFYFIVNPKSGAHGRADIVRRLRNHLNERGDHVDIALTQSLDHAADLARFALQRNYRTIIIAGGDGTVRTVAEAMAGAKIPLLILPTGTENLLAGELGLDGSLETTLKTLDNGRIRLLDLGQTGNRFFISVAGVGFDAEVIRRLNIIRSGHITHMDYIWPICRTFWEYQFPIMHVMADGELICDEPALVFVGNISRYAVGLKIFHNADCSDGLLDLTIYKCTRRSVLLGHALRTIINRSYHSPGVIRIKTRNITISSPQPYIPVQFDGDPGPAMPLTISVHPSAACVLTPPPPPGYIWHPPVRWYHLRQWLGR
ncbi:MAG: diacylglycerol kinase family lipid kinase [Sedimentisphaerales bacterium]|nr:diacylglycerol kinase family lipid kinase [Sedimentisphaerales bacterium]